MKKILLVGMLVVSGLSFGRDFDHRERNDIDHVMNYQKESQDMMSRERSISEENMEKYEGFHWELMNMDRGSDKR